MILSSELVSVTPSGNAFLDALTFDTAYLPGITINYVLKGSGSDGAFGGSTWSAGNARANFNLALQSWADVAKVTFVEMEGPYNGIGSTIAYDWIEELGPLESGVAGEHDLPLRGTLTGTYNNRFGYIDSLSVRPGGSAFSTFVHEIGHGLGLLHPHNDEGDPAGDPAFPGVDGSSDLGLYNLNQGVFTVMTYNSGYEEVGISPTYDYGWEMGPAAFDIAAVQRLYGANMETNANDTSYALPTVNASGTGWKTIWDAGGNDTIAAGDATTSPALIDLRAATLELDASGGGFVSRVAGIIGGVTIAEGALIENAQGGAGDDRLHGNSANNRLDGGAGYDTVDYSGTHAGLVIDLAAGTATGDGNDTLVSIEAAIGGSGDDVLRAIAGVQTASALIDPVKRIDVSIGSRETAMSLDGLFADHSADRWVPTANAGDGAESVIVQAQGSGGTDFYSFMVDQAGVIVIDIDNTFAFDSEVNLYDASGNLLMSNDDHDRLDPGSANTLDSFLTYSGAQAGQRLFIEVRSHGGDGAIARGASYDLNVVMDTANPLTGAVLRGSVLSGGSGSDTLYGGSGNDTLDGGLDLDTAVFTGAHGLYTITETAHDVLRVSGGQDGTDMLYDIELLRFSDGNYRWNSSLQTLTRDNNPPAISALVQNLTMTEDTRLTVTVAATDPDGDALTWQVAAAPEHGTVTGGSGGVFLYEPAANYAGTDSFLVSISDGGGSPVYQTVNLTLQPANDAPVIVAVTPSISTTMGTSQSFTFLATDPDGDPITYFSNAPQHGTLTLSPDGQQVYTPAAGFFGLDTFVIFAADDHGAKVSRTFAVTVQPPSASEPLFRLYAGDGFAGSVGGSGTVFGTNAFQDITLLDRAGVITFDASFNRGGDVIRLPGLAADYRIAQAGASALLVDADSVYTIPTGPAGVKLVFADGARTLSVSLGVVMHLSDQVVATASAAITGAAEAGAVPSAADPAAGARVFLQSGAGIEIAGKVQLFGTAGNEDVTWRVGALTLDASFNRGGDVLHLAAPPQDFAAWRAASSAVIESPSGSVTVPFGTQGMTLDFAGIGRTLAYVPAAGELHIGAQVIPGTTPAAATPLDPAGSAFSTLG